ncbi:MAG: hypothetical protein GY913_33375 [Proteobacteria bacterium]|nr:hypothetical protein [Pseudomonadota bacterium]MCP4921818.1 hypothetical protein [Pseudomonadota bacterium]
MLWWFGKTNPYVSATVAIDFGIPRDWLARVNEGQEHRITVNALMAGAIGKVLLEFPVANRRIVGTQIFQPPGVGVAMPVSLIGHEGEKRMEVSMMALRGVESLSLRDIARISKKDIAVERTGKMTDAWSDRLTRIIEASPDVVTRRIWNRMAAFNHNPLFADKVWEMAPITTALSNVGSTYDGTPGIWFRGAAVSLPDRLMHVGTLWGLSGVVDEVVAVDGEPTVRPILPVVLVFDHRLLDGYLASQLFRRLTLILRDPSSVFGEDASRIIGDA